MQANCSSQQNYDLDAQTSSSAEPEFPRGCQLLTDRAVLCHVLCWEEKER